MDVSYKLQDEPVYNAISDSFQITTIDCHPRASWFNVPSQVPALVQVVVTLNPSSNPQPAYCTPDYSTFQIEVMPVRPDFIAEVPAWTQDWFTILAQESHVTGNAEEFKVRITHPTFPNLTVLKSSYITITPCQITDVSFATTLEDMTYVFGQGPVT